MDSDISWPLHKSGEISLVLDISTDSEVLLLLFKKVVWKGSLVSLSSWSGDYSLDFGELLNLYREGLNNACQINALPFLLINNIY